MSEFNTYQGNNYVVFVTDLLVTVTIKKNPDADFSVELNNESNPTKDFLVEKLRKSKTGNHYIFHRGEINPETLLDLHKKTLTELLLTNIRSYSEDFELCVIDTENSQLYSTFNNNGGFQNVTKGDGLTTQDVSLDFQNDPKISPTAEAEDVAKILNESMVDFCEKHPQLAKGQGTYIFKDGGVKVYNLSEKTPLSEIDNYIESEKYCDKEAFDIMLK
jgi:hypothetical protein